MTNLLRIGGLASGMDIDQIVNDLMRVERIKVDKLYQQKQILEWQQEDYREVNTSLLSFRDTVFNMKLQSTIINNEITVSDDSIANITAGASAREGVYTLQVNRLASQATKESSSSISADPSDPIDINASLNSIANKFATPFDDYTYIEFTINGETFSYDLSVGGADENITLKQILDDISKNENANVIAYYDGFADKVVIKTKEYGSSATLDIQYSVNNTSNFFEALQIDISSQATGQDAEIVVNGNTITRSSNNFTIDGITFDLKKTSASAIEFTVNRDVQAAFDAIKNFIDEYNKVIDLINGKLTEERYRDYLPLTEEQKKELSDREIELWEEKARSGLLRNDYILNSIVSNMRTIMYSTVNNTGSVYNTLSEIGINTRNYSDMGKLYIDEDKLMEALNNDLEGVAALFTQSSDITDDQGIAVRLYDAVDDAIDRLTDKAGSPSSFYTYDQSYLGNSIRDLNERIDEMEDYLLQVEDRYWRQFTAMEKAINEMNAQSMWLSQQLMSFGG